MANIELTSPASIGSVPVSQGKPPIDASSGTGAVAFKDLLEAGMPTKESSESLPETVSTLTADLAESESTNVKKPTPVNLQATLDDAQADDEDVSETVAIVGGFAVFSYPQENSVDPLAGTQKAPPPSSSPSPDQSLLGQAQSAPELSPDQSLPGQAQSAPEPLASIQAATLTNGNKLPYVSNAVSGDADNNGQMLPLGVSDETVALPKDGKQVPDALSNGLIMTKFQNMRQFPAAMGNASVAESQTADSISTDFAATLVGADKSTTLSSGHRFATIAAALTTERTKARMGSLGSETITASVGNTVPKAVLNTENPLATPIADTVNLSDALSFDRQLQIQESAGLTGEVARHGVDFSLEFGSEGAEQILAERASSLSNTLGRTPPPTNPSLSSIRPDMPLAMQQDNWEKPLGQQLLWMAQNQTQQAEIRVDPPHLGPIEVHLSLNDDQAKVSFFSHDAAVRETLENALPKLRDLFDSQGMQLNQANVSDQSLARQHAETGNQSSRQGNTPRGDGAGSGNGEVEPDHTSQTPEQGNSMVDHYV